jgi:two-component sensor histidine kinase
LKEFDINRTMKSVAFLKNIIFSSWFLAIIPSVFIMLFLPSIGTKYRLQVEPEEKNYEDAIYADLNSDSISELVHLGKGVPYFHLLIQDNDKRVYDQWNLQDSIDLDMSEIFFGNYDHDRYKEIYVFTYKDDSLFLNINEFFDPEGLRLDRVYITKIKVINKKVTSIIGPAGFFDTNGDGKDELFFSIHTGFGLQPRKLYSFDIVHRDLKSSQLTGVILQNPKMVDSDGDGSPEIFGEIGASGNYNTEVPFSDWSAWLMVFDDSLRFKFPPVEFPGLTNQLETDFYANGMFKVYILSLHTMSTDTTVFKPRVMLYSLDGKMIKERFYRDLELNSLTHYVYTVVLNNRNKDRIYLLGSDLLELNDQLVVINKIKSPFNLSFRCYMTDIDFDGEDELLLYSVDEEKLVIYNAGLQKIIETRLKASDRLFKFSHYSSRDHENKIVLNAGDYGYFLKLKKNNYYYLGFLAYPGVYFLIFMFILLIKRVTTLQIVQRESLKRRLITLQLKGIKAQLDPHFTFNTLNSVASLVYLEDRDAAYDYMIKFTKLLRGMVKDAERIYRSVKEELEFVTTYLDLEKLRFKEKLEYEIKIGEGVSQNEQVPKLVLYTFAENAVKHGIMPSEKGGILKIMIDKEDDYLKLTVEDNGIGRDAAAGQSLSTGKGLKITGEFYDILNQINKKPIRHLITDLHSSKGDPAGTRVEVWVPVEEGDKNL